MVVDDGRIRSPIRRTTSRSVCRNKEVLHRKEVLTGGGRISLATPKSGVRYGPRLVAEEKCTRGDCPGGECVRPARHPGHCKSVDWVKSHKGKVVASAGADTAKGGKKRAGDRKRKVDSPAGALPFSPMHGAAALHRRTPHTTAACFGRSAAEARAAPRGLGGGRGLARARRPRRARLRPGNAAAPLALNRRSARLPQIT
jgi:hypothetical protein